MQAHSVDSCFFIKAHQITDLPLTPQGGRQALTLDSRHSVISTLQLFYGHDAAVVGSRFSSSMTVTREGRLSDHAQKTRFLSFSVAPGAKLGTMMPAAPLALRAFASFHEGGVLPWSARSSQEQARVAGEKPRSLRLDRSVRSRTGSLSTS